MKTLEVIVKLRIDFSNLVSFSGKMIILSLEMKPSKCAKTSGREICENTSFRGALAPEEYLTANNMLFFFVIFLFQIIKITSDNQLVLWIKKNPSTNSSKISLLTLIIISSWNVIVAKSFYDSCTFTKFGILRFTIYAFHLLIFITDFYNLADYVTIKRFHEYARMSNQIQYINGIPKLNFNLYVTYKLVFNGAVIGIVCIGFINNEFAKFLLTIVLVPQIINNCVNLLNAFDKYSTLALSSAYPILIYAFKAVPNDVCPQKPDYDFIFSFIVCFSVQFIILHLQKVWDPRFFLPKYLRKIAMQYRDLSQVKSTKEDCCSICFGGLDAEPLTQMNSKGENMIKRMGFEKGKVLRTQCKHEFHVECLIEWIMQKRECPLCRKLISFKGKSLIL